MNRARGTAGDCTVWIPETAPRRRFLAAHGGDCEVAPRRRAAVRHAGDHGTFRGTGRASFGASGMPPGRIFGEIQVPPSPPPAAGSGAPEWARRRPLYAAHAPKARRTGNVRPADRKACMSRGCVRGQIACACVLRVGNGAGVRVDDWRDFGLLRRPFRGGSGAEARASSRCGALCTRRRGSVRYLDRA